MDDEPRDRWLSRALVGDYLATGAFDTDHRQPWVIDGLLPRTGASMWFGTGGVGKTQLLMWLAAHLASDAATGPSAWLGAPIHRRGQILVLSSEDYREQLMGRLASILRTMVGDAKQADAICRRIHLLPFLSLGLDEFEDAAPRLFHMRGSAWEPSATMKEIETFIDRWNGDHEPADHIIGVILDSAVSMAGFELTNTEATTAFLFRLNRYAREQDVFWAIIGHQPKSTTVNSANPGANAVARLRGSAMWSTTPRTVVEVRTPTGDEQDVMRAARPDLARADAVVVTVIKANSQGADLKPRLLARVRDGAFEPIAGELPAEPDDPTDGGLSAMTAVVDIIRELTGGAGGAEFSRAGLREAIEDRVADDPRLDDLDREIEGRKASGNNLAGLLKRLAAAGLIHSPRKGPARVVDLDRPIR